MHRTRLEQIAREADSAASTHDYGTAIAKWRDALALLPAGSRQYESVASRIESLTAAQEGKTVEEIRKGPPPGSAWAKVLGPLGVAGLLLWKFKFVLVALATKGKLFFLGLTKFSTIASMFVSFGVYWKVWGWQFAAALLAGIYVHEMGHVAELRRRGMRADAPMFVPGVGAFVRMKQHAATPREDARIGLAGPLWGLGAALLAIAIALSTDSKFWLAVTHATAIINFFNLTPVWQLDGSRGFHALTRIQRGIAVAAITLAFALTREGMLIIVGLVAGYRLFEKIVPTKSDRGALALYITLIATFSALSWWSR